MTDAITVRCAMLMNENGKLRSALSDLLEQIECLGGIEYSRDLEPYKAEAVWDDAIRRAQDALSKTKEAADAMP